MPTSTETDIELTEVRFAFPVGCDHPVVGQHRGDTAGSVASRSTGCFWDKLRGRRSGRAPLLLSRGLASAERRRSSRRLSHKVASEKALHARRSSCQGGRAAHCREWPAVWDRGVAAFRSPSLERIQWARRGFMRQPPRQAGPANAPAWTSWLAGNLRAALDAPPQNGPSEIIDT